MTKIQEALDALDEVKQVINAAYASGYSAGSKTRQWVGLTLTDREEIRDQFEGWNFPAILVDVISEKLKEKNT